MLPEFATSVALSIGDYAPIRSEYFNRIQGAMLDYLFTDGVKVTRYKSSFKRAIVDCFWPAFEQGYSDGGSEPPIESDDLDWMNARVDQELGFLDVLFAGLKDFKKDSTPQEYQNEAATRAENYCRSLDGIYSQGKARGAKNKMLIFGGQDGKESCGTCQKMKGQRHKASWWKNKGLLIYQGNDNYICGCWRCQHYLYDDQGQVYTF